MSRLAQLLWLVTSLACGSAFAQTEIRWARDLPTARRAATQSRVPLLIHFYGDNCLPCKTLEERVFNQLSVVNTLNKYFICVRVNASQERATAAEYQVHSWPTDVFVSADGQLLHQGVCKQDISGYMEVLKSVAISNRDRNTMLAKANTNPLPAPNQIANGATAAQPNTSNGSLPPLTAQSTNTAFAAPPAITESTPAAQFQVAPPTRTGMMTPQAGLPPLAAHMSMQPLGSDGLGAISNVASQMNSQTNMPQASNVAAPKTQKQFVANQQATLVSNPYYLESEAMVCTPDGKCGLISSAVQNPSQRLNQPAGNQHTAELNKPTLFTSNSPANTGPQFPALAGNSAQTAPTFQPKSAMLVGTSSIRVSQPVEAVELGLIESSSQQHTEPAAYNGFCPIALVKTGLKVQGSTAHAVRHRGRTYLMESPEAVKEFMQAPDRYSPVLSGYDPTIFLETGNLVDGALEHALHDPSSGTVILFSSADTQSRFKTDPVRNTKALGYILQAAYKK